MSRFLYKSGYSGKMQNLRLQFLGVQQGKDVGFKALMMDTLRECCRKGTLVSETELLPLPADLPSETRQDVFYQFLESLIYCARMHDVTKPYDRIFAPLALARYHFRKHLPDIVPIPDYGKSLEEVYLTTASCILRSTHRLLLLDWVEDPSMRVCDRLPSWVPDFQARGIAVLSLLNGGGRESFQYIKGMDATFKLSISGPQLSINAFFLDSVLKVGVCDDLVSQPTTGSVNVASRPTAWVEFALSMNNDYVNGESAMTAFIRTMIGD